MLSTGGKTTLGADDGIGLAKAVVILLTDANIMAPTGGEILAALAMCGGVPFKKWMRYLLPLFILWWIVAFVFLVVAVKINYGMIMQCVLDFCIFFPKYYYQRGKEEMRRQRKCCRK